MQTFKGQFCVIERDDAILIPDSAVAHDDFSAVTVILDDGLTRDDINTDKVALLESRDNSCLRFTRGTPQTWDADYARWKADGWMPIGFEMVRFYSTYAEYAATLDE